MRFIHVDGARELRLLAHSLGEDHDLLEKEDGERLHLGRPVAGAAPWCRESVEAVEGPAMEKLALSRDLALEGRDREKIISK